MIHDPFIHPISIMSTELVSRYFFFHTNIWKLESDQCCRKLHGWQRCHYFQCIFGIYSRYYISRCTKCGVIHFVDRVGNYLQMSLSASEEFSCQKMLHLCSGTWLPFAGMLLKFMLLIQKWCISRWKWITSRLKKEKHSL
jgi:hypothetical protein